MGKENGETSGSGNMIIGKENTTINADNTLVSGHIHNINNADEVYSVVKSCCYKY